MRDNRIIDNVESLMLCSREELDEILLSNSYNRANLRELLRRSLSLANVYKKAWEYEREKDKE